MSLPDSEVKRYGRYGSGFFYLQAKIVLKKNLFLLFCDFFMPFYLLRKNDVKVSSKSNKQIKIRRKNFFGCGLEGHWRKDKDPKPDPLVRVMDPRIEIRIKIFTDPQH